MKKTLKITIKSKKGNIIEEGTKVTVTFPKKFNGQYMSIENDDIRILSKTINMKNYFGTKLPSNRQIEKWSFNSFCKSVNGAKVEHDGWDSNGNPSWMLALGII